jgi:hypothetical protein
MYVPVYMSINGPLVDSVLAVMNRKEKQKRRKIKCPSNLPMHMRRSSPFSSMHTTSGCPEDMIVVST